MDAYGPTGWFSGSSIGWEQVPGAPDLERIAVEGWWLYRNNFSRSFGGERPLRYVSPHMTFVPAVKSTEVKDGSAT